MNNGFRIPTLLAFLLVGGFVAVLGIFSDDAQILLGRAAKPSSTIPQSVEILNITDTTATVFWKSTDVVANTLALDSSSTTFYDIRDTDSVPKPYKLHYYQLRDLPPQKTTSFEIKAGNQIVYKGTITTGPPLTKIPQVVPLYGSAPKEIGGNHAVIKAVINGEITAILFTTTPNHWALPLAPLRLKDASDFYCTDSTCADETPIDFSFITENVTIEKSSTIGSSRPYSIEEVREIEVEVLATTSAVLSPTIAQIAQAKDPNPTKKVLPTPLPTKKASPTKTPTPTPKKTVLGVSEKIDETTITSPTEGQALSFNKPLIRGTGVANREVSISLSGQVTQIGKTKVSDKNIWQWTPSYPLTPGKYSLTMTSSDSTSKKISQTRNFFVLKSGESVLSASTPSATLIPFPTDTPTPTIGVDIPTATPTLYVTAGPEVSLFFIGGGSLLLLFALALL